MSERDLEAEFKAALAAEYKADRTAAQAFAKACECGDVDAMYAAVDALDLTIDGWRLGLKRVGRLQSVSEDVRNAFLPVWVEHKMLALKVGNRRVLLDALRILLSLPNTTGPLKLYRGTSASERRRRLYGVSWTLRQDVARDFAETARVTKEGGVVLATEAPAEAIILIREDIGDGYYEEGEVIVDPFKLGQIEVVERLPSTRPAHLQSDDPRL